MGVEHGYMELWSDISYANLYCDPGYEPDNDDIDDFVACFEGEWHPTPKCSRKLS